ncbi:MAG TPA: hypothetical protein VMB80_08435 [Candidatus Acidoferrum sp.]|nr:hypothetical protein [Candidatus Acidoferrum sp.]
MKLLIAAVGGSAGLLLAGCAGPETGLVLDPVGPPPAIVAHTDALTGSLVVYSAASANADFNSRDPYDQEYSDYRILSPEGKLLQRVHNDTGRSWDSPVVVCLSAGHYRVVARANGCGLVTVPVVIEPNQTTTVHLDGDDLRPVKSAPGKTNSVCLPDGRWVGWRKNS